MIWLRCRTRESVQRYARAGLCVFVIECVCLCCTHSSVVQRPKHDLLSATLWLWNQREIDLVCERGEVKGHFTEGWMGLILQTEHELFPLNESDKEKMKQFRAINRWVDVLLKCCYFALNIFQNNNPVLSESYCLSSSCVYKVGYQMTTH